jgi:hypothetical protein
VSHQAAFIYTLEGGTGYSHTYNGSWRVGRHRQTRLGPVSARRGDSVDLTSWMLLLLLLPLLLLLLLRLLDLVRLLEVLLSVFLKSASLNLVVWLVEEVSRWELISR